MKEPSFQQPSASASVTRYAIFVLHERSYLGGLGDRLGGLISAFSFAMRTKRTFLIEADKSFQESFTPYHPIQKDTDTADGTIKTWSNLSWTGYSEELHSTHSTVTMNCINPKPREIKCALDSDKPEQVVRIRLNRSYLCRWLTAGCINAEAELKLMGLNSSSDLLEASGCMMRLVMWPTSTLWERVYQEMSFSSFSSSSSYSSKVVLYPIISMHFRCGDLNFKGKKDGSKDTSCMYSELWHGVDFGDARSMDSPIEMSTCGKVVLNSLNNQNAVINIASDNEGSVRQMNSSLGWHNTFVPSSASCHVDLDKSGSCSLSTLLSWFTLAISDHIILQSIDESKTYFVQKTIPEGTLTAASAFSRYAAIYSLTPSLGGLRFARNCTVIDSSKFGYITQGNWVCKSKIFY